MKHLHFEEIDSTNTYLKREYQNLDNLTFVSASYQTNGHGRNARVWDSIKDKNLLFSYLIKETKLIENYSHISMFNAVLVSQFLEELGIKNVSVKWPNDVYVCGKKIAGILLEGEYPNYLVVGIGLNILQELFPNDLRHPATSIVLELPNNPDLSLNGCRSLLFNKINTFWSNFNYDWSVFDEYLKTHNYLLNKEVRIKNNNENIQGTVVEIDASCNILIKKDGKIYTVNTGEIEIIWTL